MDELDGDAALELAQMTLQRLGSVALHPRIERADEALAGPRQEFAREMRRVAFDLRSHLSRS